MFIVMETSYAYNDEIYHDLETQAGMPKRSFETRMQADDVCKQLNVDQIINLLSTGDIGMYCYDLGDLLKDYQMSLDEFKTKIKEICGRKVSEGAYGPQVNTEGLAREQKEKIAQLFRLEFFFVAECE